jgi:LytS/YehU family sensor histidine kinase
VIPKVLFKKKWVALLLYTGATYLFMVASLYYGFALQKKFDFVPAYIKQFVSFYLERDFFATAFDPIRMYNTITFYSTLFFTVMLKTTKDYFKSNLHGLHLEKEKLKLEKDNVQLELRFLKSQINPHFFFNTLNNIYSLIEDKDEHAASILLQLSDLMRYGLYESNQHLIPLERELKFVQDYVELERIRHKDNVSINLNIQNRSKNLSIPPLILATFIENAFKYGINTTIGASWVTIDVAVEASTLVFKVENSKPLKLASEVTQGGIGILNVRRRLELLYPDHYTLQIRNSASYFSVALTVELYEEVIQLRDHRRRAPGARTFGEVH